MSNALFDMVSVYLDRNKPGKATSPAKPKLHKEVKLSNDLLEEYQSKAFNWRKQGRKCIDFVNNAQWSEDDEKVLRDSNRAPVVDNQIKPAREQGISMLTANDPQAQATAKENSDVDSAQLFSDAFTHIWGNSNGKSELKSAICDYYDTGVGVMMAWADPSADWGKGEIFVKSIHSLHVYISPWIQSRLAADAGHVIISHNVTGEQLQSQYNVAIEKIREMAIGHSSKGDGSYPESDRFMGEDQDIGDIDDGLMTNKYVMVDRYSPIKVKFYHINNVHTPEERLFNEDQYNDYLAEKAFILHTSQGQEIITNNVHVLDVEKMYRETGGVFHMMQDQQTGQAVPMPGEEHEGAIPGSQVVMQEITKMDLFAAGEIKVRIVEETRIKRIFSAGDVLCWEQVLNISTLPFAFFFNGFNRNPYCMSDVKMAMSLNEFINKQLSQVVAHTANSTNQKVFVPKGVGISDKELEEKWGKAGAQFFRYDAETGALPVVVQVPPLQNAVFETINNAKTSIYHLFGIHPLQSGDPTSAPSTYKGTLAIDQYAQRRIGSKLDDIEAGLNQMNKAIVEMIQDTYTEEKIIRLFDPNETTKTTVLNEPVYDEITGEFLGRINDVSIGKYDIVVVAGSTLPSNRWARTEMLEGYADKGWIDQEALLVNSDIPDIQGILSRSSQRAQMAQQIQGLEEEVKNLKGDLQTATRESLHDKKRLEVEKFSTKLDQAANKIDSASQLFEKSLQLEKQSQKVNQGNKNE